MIWESINFTQNKRLVESNDHGLIDGDKIHFVSDGKLPYELSEDIEYLVSYVGEHCFSVYKEVEPDTWSIVPIYDEGTGNHSFFVAGESPVTCEFSTEEKCVRNNNILIDCNMSNFSDKLRFPGKTGLKILLGNGTNAQFPPDTKVSQVNQSINEYEDVEIDGITVKRWKKNLGRHNNQKMTAIERRDIMADERIKNVKFLNEHRQEIEKAKEDISNG